MPNPNEDYYAWTQETIEKLRQGEFSEIDREVLIEEVEDMGKSEKRELESRLTTLLMHLLKWQYQPERKGKNWRLTIEVQRRRVLRLLRDNPSLKPQLPMLGIEAYEDAVIEAAMETTLEKTAFPSTFEQTDWSWEEVLDDEFYPD